MRYGVPRGVWSPCQANTDAIPPATIGVTTLNEQLPDRRGGAPQLSNYPISLIPFLFHTVFRTTSVISGCSASVLFLEKSFFWEVWSSLCEEPHIK